MIDLSLLKDRDQLGEFLNQHGLTGVGVEVGAKNCANARQIISTWRGQVLHVIDPWEAQDPAVYKERQDWTNFEDCYKECAQLKDEYQPRIVLHKALSLDVAPKFADGFLDFCYIDGNHSHEAVMDDLHHWWPKVKTGGLFGGHDFYDDKTWPAYCEVKTAVSNWAPPLPIHHTPKCGSWWIVKI